MPPARVTQILRRPSARAVLQMPFLCEEHGGCCCEATKSSKRPRTFAGTEAANLGGTGFLPAGYWGVSSRKPEDDARYAKVFLTNARTYTNGQCRARGDARLTGPGEAQAMAVRRRRVKQNGSFEARLLIRAQATREAAHRLPPGKQREMLLGEARASGMAAQIDKWISSPGLRPPK